MSKKITLFVLFITTLISGFLFYNFNKKTPDITRTQIAKSAASDNNLNNVVFYDLKKPEHLKNENNNNLDTRIIPCTSDLECQAKNKNVNNPYDIVLLNEANDNINEDAISERDRLEAEAFAQAFDDTPLTEQKAEIYEMLDKLSNIQENLDTHKAKAQGR